MGPVGVNNVTGFQRVLRGSPISQLIPAQWSMVGTSRGSDSPHPPVLLGALFSLATLLIWGSWEDGAIGSVEECEGRGNDEWREQWGRGEQRVGEQRGEEEETITGAGGRGLAAGGWD